MSAVRSRLRMLERRAAERGRQARGFCSACGGEGAPGIVLQYAGEPPEPEPDPCPDCRRLDLTRVAPGPRHWTRARERG